MQEQVVLSPQLQYSAFSRLGALVARGYSPSFASNYGIAPEAQFVDLTHPSKSKRKYVPQLRLWSNGTVETGELLWPSHYVPSERVAVPKWQRFIFAEDDHIFERFTASVAPPSFLDLQLKPLWRVFQTFAFRLLFGFCLCASIAGLIATLMSLARH